MGAGSHLKKIQGIGIDTATRSMQATELAAGIYED
jgi:hypothetical protein